jgi:hypothetical protein
VSAGVRHAIAATQDRYYLQRAKDSKVIPRRAKSLGLSVDCEGKIFFATLGNYGTGISLSDFYLK